MSGVPPTPSVLYMIKQVELAIRAGLEDILKSSGVTVPQYTALSVLRQRDGISSAQLARNSFVTAQSMGDLVAALERGGLIARTVDPAHRRRLLITLTPAGREFLRRYDAQVSALEERMLKNLSAEETSDLRHAMNSCRVSLMPDPPDPA